jgi:hypothetical protein
MTSKPRAADQGLCGPLPAADTNSRSGLRLQFKVLGKVVKHKNDFFRFFLRLCLKKATSSVGSYWRILSCLLSRLRAFALKKGSDLRLCAFICG